MFENIKCALFDLDGTLIDSMWMWGDIDRQYLARFDIKCPEGLQKCIAGMSFSETASYFKKRFNLPDTLQKIKADWNEMAWDKYENEVPLKAGAVGMLEFLYARNIPMCIATSNSRELVSLITKKHGIDKYFHSIITGCDVEKGKPSPDIYLKCAETVGVLPENSIVFEDIPEGIIAGKSAGMTVCAMEDKFSKNVEEQKRRLADYYADNFFEVIDKWSQYERNNNK